MPRRCAPAEQTWEFVLPLRCAGVPSAYEKSGRVSAGGACLAALPHGRSPRQRQFLSLDRSSRQPARAAGHGWSSPSTRRGQGLRLPEAIADPSATIDYPVMDGSNLANAAVEMQSSVTTHFQMSRCRLNAPRFGVDPNPYTCIPDIY